MDPSGAAVANKNKKKRGSSDEALEVEDESKRSCPNSFLSRAGIETVVEQMVVQSQAQIKEPMIGEVVNRFFVEKLPQLEQEFRKLVSKEIERMILSSSHSLSLSVSKLHESGKDEVPTPSRTLSKFKLRFSNPIASIIFTNNEIKSENGKPLKVELCDASNSNTIISTGPLSSAQVEFFILHGEFDSSKRRHEETPWTSSDFNKSILTPREGKRPLIVGNDLQLHLQNGVGVVNNLIVTDNSSWMKSKMFCLGVKIKDEKFLVEFGRIGEAVSRPFRVRDQRGEVNQKHHPPSRKDEVWRLEGIGKDGTYHTSLSSCGIMTVGDFLDVYHQMGPTYMKKILGRRVLEKTWNMMISNARECLPSSNNDQIVEANNLLENQAMGAAAVTGNYGVIHTYLGHNYELSNYHADDNFWEPSLPSLPSLPYY